MIPLLLSFLSPCFLLSAHLFSYIVVSYSPPRPQIGTRFPGRRPQGFPATDSPLSVPMAPLPRSVSPVRRPPSAVARRISSETTQASLKHLSDPKRWPKGRSNLMRFLSNAFERSNIFFHPQRTISQRLQASGEQFSTSRRGKNLVCF